MDMPGITMTTGAPTVNAAAGRVREFALDWPCADNPGTATVHDPFSCCRMGQGSTHELVFDPHPGAERFWVSGQLYDHIAQVTLDGVATYHAMPPGSLPHGMTFDADGRLWVTLEGHGALARIDRHGAIVERVDVRLHATGASAPINTRPHGLGLGHDGALWFTGKLTNTVGRVDRHGRVEHLALPTIGAVPIYIAAGGDGTMWCTELVGGRIARIAADRSVQDFAVPTADSRPIAIRPAPDGRTMWFTQEAGGKVARIDGDGTVTEFPMPLAARGALLAGLAFDTAGNLWVQQYLPPPTSGEAGDDYIVRLGAGIHHAPPGDLSDVSVTFYKAPSRRTVMHRIVQGSDGAMWFSELGLDRIGRVDPV